MSDIPVALEIDPDWDRPPVSLQTLQREHAAGHRSLVELGGKDREMTCDECNWAPCCKLAWDAYNTDGDCLRNK